MPREEGERLRTRCAEGWLIITDDAVRLERGGVRSRSGAGAHVEVMPRTGLVGATRQNRLPALFGRGGVNTLIFINIGGQRLIAHTVTSAAAQEALTILGYA